MMDKNAKIYVAGHRGLVGSALVRGLQARGYKNLLLRTHAELDLTNALATQAFFQTEKPDYVFLAAAKVGGILANNNYPADFIRENLAIQNNVIEQSHATKVKRLLFLGSSCIYPRDCPQPIKEEYLLTGPLEPTNRPYALAKIAGIEMCWSYNRQFGTQYLAVMPTNLYGPGDNYDLNNSHVLPALIRKFHEAKLNSASHVTLWGTGKPKREFLYSEDMADACLFLMSLSGDSYKALLEFDQSEGRPPLVNVGVGQDISILDLAKLVQEVTGFNGSIQLDVAKPDGAPRKLLEVSRLTNLGWQPSVNLKEGIAKTYQNYIDGLGKESKLEIDT